MVLPHPAVGFAIVGVDADGLLTVLHGSSIVPQLAVGCCPAHAKTHTRSWFEQDFLGAEC